MKTKAFNKIVFFWFEYSLIKLLNSTAEIPYMLKLTVNIISSKQIKLYKILSIFKIIDRPSKSKAIDILRPLGSNLAIACLDLDLTRFQSENKIRTQLELNLDLEKWFK